MRGESVKGTDLTSASGTFWIAPDRGIFDLMKRTGASPLVATRLAGTTNAPDCTRLTPRETSQVHAPHADMD